MNFHEISVMGRLWTREELIKYWKVSVTVRVSTFTACR